jgi:hypothetical protein
MKIDAVTFLPSMGSGGEDMVKADLWHEIHSRRKLRESKKSIARTLGLHVQTVRSILTRPGICRFSRSGRLSRPSGIALRQDGDSFWTIHSLFSLLFLVLNLVNINILLTHARIHRHNLIYFSFMIKTIS